MPYVYDPDAAIIIGASDGVEVELNTFALQEEDFLLVHRCRRSARVGNTTRHVGQLVTRSGSVYSVEAEPRLLYRSDTDPQLSFSVEAEALSLSGLADFHPGLCLDDYALGFLNGSASDLPFRFTAGRWIYMDPEQDCAAGDLTQISFTVLREFATLRPDAADPVYYALIPEQAAVPLPLSAIESGLQDIFHATSHFTGDFTATLYDGDPDASGTVSSEVRSIDAWGERRLEGIYPYENTLRHGSQITWEAQSTARHITHILLERGERVAVIALAAALEVPAGSGVRAPVLALGVSIQWAINGDLPGGVAPWPGFVILEHACGTALPADASLQVEVWDTPGYTGTVLASELVSRSAAEWTVVGNTVESIGDVAGGDPAPVGGWSLTWQTVRFPSLAGVWLIGRVIDPQQDVAESDSFLLPAGTVVLDLDDTFPPP